MISGVPGAVAVAVFFFLVPPEISPDETSKVYLNNLYRFRAIQHNVYEWFINQVIL